MFKYIPIVVAITCATSAAAESTSPKFPADINNWDQASYACFQSGLISLTNPAADDGDDPTKVYRYQVNGGDIAVVTYTGKKVTLLQILEAGVWQTFSDPDKDLMKLLLKRVKALNEAVDAKQAKNCSTAAAMMST